MGLILLSITMFFTMLFATVNAIRNESRAERGALPRNPLMK